MLRINGLYKTFHAGTANETAALDDLSLHLRPGEFVTVVGGNGSGKSTMLGAIAGVFLPDRGSVILDGHDVTALPEHRRAHLLGRVFQDPMMGTAAELTMEDNLALALRRGKRRGLAWGVTRRDRRRLREALARLELGLEDRMGTRIGLLSGGQRQAITLLMATLKKPELLLLDEHTAALDPKTAAKVLEISETLIRENGLTALMITHNMADAIRYGNRLIMMQNGRVVFEAGGEEKKALTVPAMVEKFNYASYSSRQIP
jgi:putative ABC transport system ATP-binding protein